MSQDVLIYDGSVETNDYKGRYYVLGWEVEQSIENNTSTLSWKIEAIGGKNSWYAERTLTAVIAGTTVYSKTEKVSRYEGIVASGTLTLNHYTDGTRAFSASIQAAVYVSSINCSGSDVFSLPRIPRQASIISAPDFTDEGNPTITYSNPAGNAVEALDACISLTGAADDIKYRAISKTGSSYTFNLTDAEREVLRKATTNSKTRTVRFYIRTTIGAKTYLKYFTKTLTIVDAAPSFNVDIYDIDADMLLLTGDKTKLVKYYSNPAYTITATGKKGASIASYKASNNTTRTTASGEFYNIANGNFEFSVVDSRGYTTTKKVEKSLIEYVKPTCRIEATAPTVDGNLTFSIRGDCFNGSFGAVNNAVVVKYRYKTNGGSYTNWITVDAEKIDNTYVKEITLTGLNYQNSYTIQGRIEDSITAVDSSAKTLRTTPVYDWDGNDFNFNVPVCLNNDIMLRRNADSGSMVVSAEAATIHLRPNGSYNADNQVILYPDGELLVNGDLTVNGMTFGKNQVLWNGGWYMSAGHTITFMEDVDTGLTALETVPNGLVFVWSYYSGGSPQDYYWHYFFVPKFHYLTMEAQGVNMVDAYKGMNKYIYISRDEVFGLDKNAESGTENGINYNNASYVLRYIISV